ncbi:hypothetical protein M8J77_020540 [Diaphorina citri]|nr:hypothetical protein M8J77_020540 [Diaphorina citri]
MGSPLSPLLSEFYMLQFEKEIHKLNPNLVNNIVYLHRYVDDILMLWKGSKRQLDLFLQNANKIYSNFTLELECGGKEINFLDLNISIHEGKHRFKIYRKPSYTDVIIPASSYHMYNHKMAFFRNMYNRVLEVSLERDDFMSELKTIRNIGENNGYSNYEMKKVFYNTLKNKVEKLLYTTRDANTKRYVGLPYVRSLEHPVNEIFRKYGYKPAFQSKPLTSLFNRKDKVEDEECSGVYKLTCECGAEYVGMTRRNIKTRTEEHIAAARNSTKGRSNYADHLIDEGHDYTKTKLEVLYKGNKYREVMSYEQIYIHESVRRNLNLNAVIDTLPSLVYATEQLIQDHNARPTPTQTTTNQPQSS